MENTIKKYLAGKCEKIVRPPFERVAVSRNKEKKRKKSFIVDHSRAKICFVRGTDAALAKICAYAYFLCKRWFSI